MGEDMGVSDFEGGEVFFVGVVLGESVPEDLEEVAG